MTADGEDNPGEAGRAEGGEVEGGPQLHIINRGFSQHQTGIEGECGDSPPR
jgi:hypothetical protein